MGYLFILGALFVGACKGYCGKRTSEYTEKTGDVFVFDSVRMILCVLVGFIFVLFENGGLSSLSVDGTMLAVSAASGFCNAGFVVFWLFAVRKNTYMMLDITTMLGCIIPAAGCYFAFQEAIAPTTWIGFALLIAAVVIMGGYSKDLFGTLSVGGVALMVIAALCEGGTGFAQQLYKHLCADTYSNSVFNFYTYVFAALFLSIVAVFFLFRKDYRETLPHFLENTKKLSLLLLIMSVCLFAYSYFSSLATTVGGISSQILYPVLKGGGLILSTLIAVFLLHEKPTLNSLIGTALAMAGIVCVNLL